MNVNKRNNYQLTGSIHTLSLISLPVTDIDESISPCFDTLSSRENLSYSKINANKLVGDLFSYDEFKTAFDTILGGAGIESYSLSRFDMRFDSFDPEHYRDYQVQRLTGKWFYLPDVHAIAEYYNTSTYSIYQLLTHSPKEIKGIYELYESDNIKIKVRKEK